jgi:hypothetical protein
MYVRYVLTIAAQASTSKIFTTLDVDQRAYVDELLKIIRRDKDGDSGWLGEFAHVGDAVKGKYPARRYLALSAQNCCHFVSPGPRVEQPAEDFALWLYYQYHRRALALARTHHVQPGIEIRCFCAVPSR